jgi:exodeoxyribonuclease VII small subunit
MAEAKFEKDLERLEQIVEALETGGLSLDESLKRFEEGIKLARRCEKALTDAEKRIEILVKNAQGEIVAEPFLTEGEEPGDPAGNSESDDEEDPAPGKPAGTKEGGLLF